MLHPHPSTAMLGQGYDPGRVSGSLKPPIFPTSTFVFPTAEEGKRCFELAYGLREPTPGEEPGMIYSRLSNPGLEILEQRVAYLDGTEKGLSFSSGMAAISTVMLSFLRPGDVLVHSRPLYGGTDHVVTEILEGMGIQRVEITPEDDPSKMEERITAVGGKVALAYIETPANPTNALFDIEAVARVAHSHGAPLTVDNTFLGPTWQCPAQLGADLVIYSATKFLGGHSDLIAGVVTGHAEVMAPVAKMRTFLGTMCDPWTAWLLTRSLETLDLRMHRQAENAARLAGMITDHPAVRRVSYLGSLEAGSRDHDLFKRQCLGPGSMISIWLEDEAAAFRFLNSLEVVRLAVSLGSTESLAQHPTTMTHAGCDPHDRERLGITSGLVRLSVGIEYFDDLQRDVLGALDRA